MRIAFIFSFFLLKCTNMQTLSYLYFHIQFFFCGRVSSSLTIFCKCFFHLHDVTLYNAFILYKLKTEKIMHLSDFRLEVIRSIIESVGSQKKGRPSLENPMRLTAWHFPSYSFKIIQLNIHLKEEGEESAMSAIIQQQLQRKKLKQLKSVLNVMLVYVLYLVLSYIIL
jgi:hypothetical protein